MNMLDTELAGVDVGHIERKSLLYRSDVEYGGWTINHCQGCTHGCLYPCYAMQLAKRTGRVQTYEEWRQPKVVANAMGLLEKELVRHGSQIDSVHLSFTTDPFMFDPTTDGPVAEVAKLTESIVRRLNEAGIRVTLLTKGVYPEDFIEMSRELDPRNSYGISLVSMSEDYRRQWEPGAAPTQLRVAALERLHDLGMNTWVSMEPYPTPNIDPTSEDPTRVLHAIEFTDALVYGRWNYSRLVSSFEGADEHYAEVAERVVRWCDSHSVRLRIKSGTPSCDKYKADVLGAANAA